MTYTSVRDVVDEVQASAERGDVDRVTLGCTELRDFN